MKKGIKNYLNNKPWQVFFFEVSTYLFVGTLPLWLKLNTIVLWLFILSSVITMLKEKDFVINVKRNRLPLLALLTLFALYVFGFFLSEKSSIVMKHIIRTLPLFIVPFFVFSNNRKNFNLKGIYVSLGVGLFIGMLVCWFQILISIWSNNKPIEQAKYFFEWIYTGWNLVSPLEVHPSYFAVLIVIFLSAIIINDNFKKIRENKLKFGLLIFPYFLFLIETSSRIGIITFFIILLVYSIKKIKLKGLFLMLGLFFLIVFFSLKFDYLGSKFSKILSWDGEIKIERYYRWVEILKVFNKEEKLFLGVGSGDTQKVYESAYIIGHFDLALDNNYNAHNQYLEFLVSNGVLGLVVYVIVFVVFWHKTRLNNETLSFFVVFLLFSISESFFERSQGVLIFSFFYSFSILYYNTGIKNDNQP